MYYEVSSALDNAGATSTLDPLLSLQPAKELPGQSSRVGGDHGKSGLSIHFQQILSKGCPTLGGRSSRNY